MRAIIIVVIFASLSSWALSAPKTMDDVIKHYLVIQKQLVANKMDKISSEAKAIAERTAGDSLLGELNSSASDLEKTKSVAEAREIFKKLSAPVAAWTLKNKPQGITVWKCPMAKADWVQDSKDIHNPYGSDMESCGEKIL